MPAVPIPDEFPGENHSPQSLGGSSVILAVYVEDVDLLFESAKKAGVKVIRPPTDQPYGRVCKLEDPFGHVWIFGQALASEPIEETSLKQDGLGI